jgi:hypothetical protein
MTTSQTGNSTAERRLAIAHRLYEALVGQDPDRATTLCDSSGSVVARHDPGPRPANELPQAQRGSSRLSVSDRASILITS